MKRPLDDMFWDLCSIGGQKAEKEVFFFSCVGLALHGSPIYHIHHYQEVNNFVQYSLASHSSLLQGVMTTAVLSVSIKHTDNVSDFNFFAL